MRMVLFALPVLLLATPALAQERSKTLTAVVDCRKISDAGERLACFDKTVAAFDTAEQQQQVVVVDKEQVREARRSIFGLNLPHIRLFGGDGTDAELSELQGTIRSFNRNADGRLFFVLEDGARWVQTDDSSLVGIRAGTAVTLKRGAMGSYFAKFRGSSTARVARVN